MAENLILADDLTMIGEYRKLKDYTNNSGPRHTANDIDSPSKSTNVKTFKCKSFIHKKI